MRRTWIIGTADWNSLGELVLDVDVTVALLAEGIDVGVGLVELSILAEQATMGLATSGLEVWPLTLGVTWWAGIGAQRAFNTVWLGASTNMSLLDTSPLVVTNPFNWDGSVLFWEMVAIDFSIWEGRVDASGWGWLLWWLWKRLLCWFFLFGGGSGGWLGLGGGWLLGLLMLLLLLLNRRSSCEGLEIGGPWDSVLVDSYGFVDNLGTGDASTHMMLVTDLSSGMTVVNWLSEGGGRGGKEDSESDKVGSELHC